MESKLEQYDYPSLVMKYIPEQNLVHQIQINIDFVENYIDRVEEIFPSVTEQQIMYKQLGSIAFSCTESLWKSLVLAVNAKCRANDCHEKKCEYRKFDSARKLNAAKIRDIIDHLQNMRLIMITEFEMEGIEELQHLRNHVHLTLSVSTGDQSEKFNKDYVESMLRLYYVTLNQLELNEWHLKNDHACLKEVDENCYEETAKRNKLEARRYISDEIIYLTSNLFYDREIPEYRQNILKKLSSKKNYEEERVTDWIGQWLYFQKPHFQSEEKYFSTIEKYYEKLQKYLSSDRSLIDRIKERLNYYLETFTRKQ